MTKGLPAVFFASKESMMGTSTVGMVVDATLGRIAAGESVRALSGGMLERGHGTLRVRKLQRQGEEG